MPITFTIDEQKNRIFTVASAPFIDADLIQFANALHSDPAMKPGMTELGDLSGLRSGEIQVTTAGIRVMIRVEKEYPEVRLNRRITIYSPEDLEFGMSKIYQNYEEVEHPDLGIRIFRDREEAEAWLDQYAI